METPSEAKKKVPDSSATNKAVEENQDLKRQVVFLQQQLVEKDRRIKKLESLVAGGGNNSPASIIKQRKNSASQVKYFSSLFIVFSFSLTHIFNRLLQLTLFYSLCLYIY